MGAHTPVVKSCCLQSCFFFRFISLSLLTHTHVHKQAHVHTDACFTIQLNTCTQYMLCKHGPKSSTSERAPSRFSRIITFATLKNLNVFFFFFFNTIKLFYSRKCRLIYWQCRPHSRLMLQQGVVIFLRPLRSWWTVSCGISQSCPVVTGCTSHLTL